MVDKSNIFSGKALAKLRGPEDLDTMMKLTSPHAWAGLAVLGLIILIAVLWGILGSVPVRVQGLGAILNRDSKVYDVAAPAVGRVTSIDVKLNQVVPKGQRLAILSMPSRETQQQNELLTLNALKAQFQEQSSLFATNVENRRINTEAGIRALGAKISASQKRLTYLRELYATQKQELTKGYVTRQQVEDILNEINTTVQLIRDSKVQIEESKASLLEYELQQTRTLTELRQQILAAEGTLSQTSVALETDRIITSPVDGTVVELDVKLDTLVDIGAPIAVIEKAGEGFEAVAFFEIGKGKKIHPGMQAQVSPGSTARDLYGSIVGKVVSVSEFPETRAGLMEVLGNEDLVASMMGAGAPIKVVIFLEKDPKAYSGLKWSSSGGPPTKITSGDSASVSVTVERKKPIDIVVPIFKAWKPGN